MSFLRANLFAGLVAALVALPSASLAQMPPGGPGFGPAGPTEVGVMELTSATVPYSVTLPGRAVASAQADIRPRVDGMIEEITYAPGARVNAGDVLFRLETSSYEADLAVAQAAQDSAQVAVDTAQASVDRYAQLEGLAITTSDLQTARSTLAAAKASLRAAQAQVQSAQIDLDRTEITSPIAGIVDLPTVSVGAIVTANQTDALTSVTRLDPIFVDVAESSTRLTRVRAEFESGALHPLSELDVTLTLENGDIHTAKGTMVSPGIAVSTTTGSVDLRFEFSNDSRRILPGQFLRVDIVIGEEEAILVPQRATTRQSDGTLTAFVVDGETARQVTLTYTGTHENAWVVTEGVSAGDLIILDGLSNLSNGAQITTTPVTIDARGVVQDAQVQE